MILGIFESWAQFLEVLGVWVAALATFLATYTALRLANKENKQAISVIARPMTQVLGMNPKEKTHLFQVQATNIGNRPVTIHTVGFSSPVAGGNVVLPMALAGSSSLPVLLSHGEMAQWNYPIEMQNGKNWYNNFSDAIKDKSSLIQWLFLRTCKFYVATSLRNVFTCRPSPKFAEAVKERLS